MVWEPRISLAACAAIFLLTTMPSGARACSDAGAPNALCSDGGLGEWIGCSVHSDCPAGQVCGADGHCSCSCSVEECEGDACRCCATSDMIGSTRRYRFWCADDAGLAEADAGSTGSTDAGPRTAMDASTLSAADPSPACSARPGAASPVVLLALALVGVVIRVRR